MAVAVLLLATMQQSARGSNHESLGRSGSTSAGLLGYLAVMAGVLALLSAPVLTVTAVLALGVGVAAGRSLAVRQRPAVSGADDAAALGRDAPAK